MTRTIDPVAFATRRALRSLRKSTRAVPLLLQMPALQGIIPRKDIRHQRPVREEPEDAPAHQGRAREVDLVFFLAVISVGTSFSVSTFMPSKISTRPRPSLRTPAIP
jgi:hypothetical protein